MEKKMNPILFPPELKQLSDFKIQSQDQEIKDIKKELEGSFKDPQALNI